MIDFSRTFDEIKGQIALACENDIDARALIFAADNAARMNALAVSCDLNSVNMLWTWLEKSKIKIFARLVIQGDSPDVQKVAAAIHGTFKKGATGIQLIASPIAHEKLAMAIAPIAADLFFGRELILTMDLDSVYPDKMAEIFQNIKTASASGLGIMISKSENTAGALYGILDSWDLEFCGTLQIISKDMDFQTIEDAWRLIKKMRPELIPGTIFFISQQ